MGKVTRRLLVTALSLVVVFMVGCFVPISYERTKTAISPGEVFRISINVAEDEVLQGSWVADEDIVGSYIRPDSTKLSWTLPSTEHTFLIRGEGNSGSYVFYFRNSGDEAGVLKFRYRIKQAVENNQP